MSTLILTSDKKQTEVLAENIPSCLSPVEEQEVQTSSEITSEFTSEITSEFTSEPAIIGEIPTGQGHSRIERKNTIDDEMIMPIEEIGTYKIRLDLFGALTLINEEMHFD